MLPKTRPAPRPGFTLVELLVVITIIGVLAGLLLAAVSKVRETVRTTSTRSDITQLDQAMSEFKSKFNGRPAPCFGGGPFGTFRLCSTYTDAAGTPLAPFTATSPEIVLLKQIFPRINLNDTGLRLPIYNPPPMPIVPQPPAGGAAGAAFLIGPGRAIPNPILLDPNQCMVFFLSGGSFTGYTGFATDPQQPFKAPALATEGRIEPFFAFPQKRMVRPIQYTPTRSLGNPLTQRFVGDDTVNSVQEPWFTDNYGQRGNPYLYLASLSKNNYPFDPLFVYTPDPTVTASATATLKQSLQIAPWGGTEIASQLTNISQYIPTTGAQPAASPTGPEFVRPLRDDTAVLARSNVYNPDGFQIWSAGENGLYGWGGQFRRAYGNPAAVYGRGDWYVDGKPGGDDFVNFFQLKLSSDQN